ncbi:glycosyltransferase family 2 protein [Hugenholtzia roseola]|uniref:glycosyltransferase family 2 protein n=1 Tax=Hugenholtzia roseola TaxID=1002 RepID=UPI0003F5C4E4|nr:glycosyltransferase [Hugenholtzia roseola]
MDFSFVITYRDREVEAVKRCLGSLLNQKTTSRYEICFVDYGSQEQFRQPLAAFIATQLRIRYAYAPTRGWLWCRSHANNLGLDLAQGKYIVMVDVDLIYPDFFLEKIKKYIDEQTQVLYHCYFAPKEFGDYDTLNFTKAQPFRHTSETLTETGLMAAPKVAFLKAAYYDEYFKVWGIEDAEMNQRIQKVGYKPFKMPLDEVYGVHQWHLSNTLLDIMPKNWYDFMKRRTLKTTQKTERYYLPKNELESLSPLRKLENITQSKIEGLSYQNFKFEVPFAYDTIKFFNLFENLKSGEALHVAQKFEWIGQEGASKVGKMLNFFNKKASQYKISYRITEALPFETEMIDFLKVRDFLYFFLVENESRILDYFLEVKPREKIELFIIKR